MKKIEELCQTIIKLEKVLDYQTHLLADSMILTSYDWVVHPQSIVVIYHASTGIPQRTIQAQVKYIELLDKRIGK